MNKREINTLLIVGFILIMCHVLLIGAILMIIGIYNSATYNEPKDNSGDKEPEV